MTFFGKHTKWKLEVVSFKWAKLFNLIFCLIVIKLKQNGLTLHIYWLLLRFDTARFDTVRNCILCFYPWLLGWTKQTWKNRCWKHGSAWGRVPGLWSQVPPRGRPKTEKHTPFIGQPPLCTPRSRAQRLGATPTQCRKLRWHIAAWFAGKLLSFVPVQVFGHRQCGVA